MITQIRDKQREYFKKGNTLDYSFRIMQLKKLKNMMIQYEDEFINALKEDMNKCEFEAIASELYMVLEEIDMFIKNLKKWMKLRKVKKNLLTFDAKTTIISKPYGVSLIISPWNYPVQLTLVPVVGAIGSGNTVIIAPSQLTPKVYDVLRKAINSTFDEEYCTVIDKSIMPEDTTKIEYDKIFFTGSPRVGKIIMESASKYLTSITLELGGKSPVIVNDATNIKKAIKRILWGKFLNSGQTCVSPDYLLVKETLKEEFIATFKSEIQLFLKERKLNRIINQNHYNRLKSYLLGGNIIFGGECDDDNISMAITLIEPLNINVPLMQEEIFGPIFPIVYYNSKEDAKEIIESVCNRPLAMYIFSTDEEFISYFLDNIYFGGGCVNDTISHILNPHAPFGGVANSGIGQYHGFDSFKCFSKDTTVLRKGYSFEINTKYPPYSKHLKSLKGLYNKLKK